MRTVGYDSSQKSILMVNQAPEVPQTMLFSSELVTLFSVQKPSVEEAEFVLDCDYSSGSLVRNRSDHLLDEPKIFLSDPLSTARERVFFSALIAFLCLFTKQPGVDQPIETRI